MGAGTPSKIELTSPAPSAVGRGGCVNGSSPSTEEGEDQEHMTALYPSKVQKAVDALLTNPADCTPMLRQAVEAYAARLCGGAREAPEMPADLADYVRKVTLYAYTTTDEDIQRLKEAGYSEDAIFEITFCASLGAGLARLERGLEVLKGGS